MSDHPACEHACTICSQGVQRSGIAVALADWRAKLVAQRYPSPHIGNVVWLPFCQRYELQKIASLLERERIQTVIFSIAIARRTGKANLTSQRAVEPFPLRQLAITMLFAQCTCQASLTPPL